MTSTKEWFLENWQQGVFLFGMVTSTQFVVCSLTAMLFYPGEFSFFSDPLCQLGFTRIEGKSNLLSSFLFNPSMFLVGISVALLFPAMLPFFSETLVEKWFSLAGSIFAVFSGIATCGTALTPGDIHFEAHIALAPFTVLFGVLMVFFFSVPMFLNKDYPRQYFLVSILSVIIMVICLVLLFIVPSYDTPEGAVFPTFPAFTTQKIAIFAEIITLFLLSYGAFRFNQSQKLLII
ncbi:MAG: hypothetical protein ACFFAE_17295 [Candidatus Hodarchaeota archaeon]